MVYCVYVIVYYALLIYVVDDILNANDKLLNTTDKVEEYILWLKVVKVLILIHPPPPPPSQYSNNWYQSRSFKKQFNHWKEIMEYAKIGAPRFDGHNYAFWNKRMKTFLQAQGFDVWKSVVDGYTTPTTPPTDKDGKKLSENNSKAKGTILSSLDDSIFVKVMHCNTAKDLWDKLQNIYEGDAKVKGAKLQTLRAKFEQLKMKEDEDIATYFL
jgi:hypothetical protein